MPLILTVLLAVAVLVLFWMGARFVMAYGDDRQSGRLGDEKQADKFPRRDLNANVNPSQLGNEADLWPDRTGARTRRELGARHAADVTYQGDAEEHGAVAADVTPHYPARSRLEAQALMHKYKELGQADPEAVRGAGAGAERSGGAAAADAGHGAAQRPASGGAAGLGAVPGTGEENPEASGTGGDLWATQPPGEATAYGVVQSDPAAPAQNPGIRRQVQAGLDASETGQDGELAPEDAYGEDRPANRTQAPDAPPTQWHPKNHGVPGDHERNGYHTSATGPEKISDAKDPYAHAPVPGPNHIPPESGEDFPDGIRP